MCAQCDFEERLEQCVRIQELIEKLPPRCPAGFRDDVEENVRGVERTIEAKRHCTQKQCNALDNWEAGIRKWLPDGS